MVPIYGGELENRGFAGSLASMTVADKQHCKVRPETTIEVIYLCWYNSINSPKRPKETLKTMLVKYTEELSSHDSQSSSTHVFLIQSRLYVRRNTKIVVRPIEMPAPMSNCWRSDSGWSKFEVSPGGGGNAGVGWAVSIFYFGSSFVLRCR